MTARLDMAIGAGQDRAGPDTRAVNPNQETRKEPKNQAVRGGDVQDEREWELNDEALDRPRDGVKGTTAACYSARS